MMLRSKIWFAAAASVVSQAAYPAEPPVALAPTSNWHIDYANEKCRLARTFGEGEEVHLLYLEMAGPAVSFDMTVAGPGLSDYSDDRDALVTFGSNEPFADDSFFVGSLERIGPALILSGIRSDFLSRDKWQERDSKQAGPAFPVLDIETIGTSDEITIAQEGRAPVVFATGNMRAPLTELNACAVSFIEHWGLDLAKHRTALRLPEWTNLRSIAARIQKSYPADALRAGEEGLIHMRVIIDENGRVAECYQRDATMLEELRSPVCKLMEDARFEPAIDADGQPMRSYFAGLIRFYLP